jgi:hypothetical protein
MTTTEQQRTRNGDYIDVAGVKTYYENADVVQRRDRRAAGR